ncbi:MAG: VPDSG-CTERM sorting domain-containing protein [Verrucomicrobia bacterium]|nr:MAG: hypothetical protein DMF26_04560 [Verrucomicrobiota bacterium]TMP93401.1 MAG: VPDSG-CTERM sorting domain-containing protein [Verrucomicrobiota bacterium]
MFCSERSCCGGRCFQRQFLCEETLGGSTVSLLGCALLGLAALRRKLSC